MSAPKFEVPVQFRDVAGTAIDQAEKAFDMFFAAANTSMRPFSHPGAEVSKKGLSITEQNVKAALEAARKIALATDFQEVMQIQMEFLQNQFMNTAQQMKQIGDDVVSTAKDIGR